MRLYVGNYNKTTFIHLLKFENRIMIVVQKYFFFTKPSTYYSKLMQMEDGPHPGLPALPTVLCHNSPNEFQFIIRKQWDNSYEYSILEPFTFSLDVSEIRAQICIDARLQDYVKVKLYSYLVLDI